VALILRRRGIERVRPLAGGFHAWRDLGYPVQPLPRAVAVAAAVAADSASR
jgi:3-mercaptopyruvate sulfurtransferase SseA